MHELEFATLAEREEWARGLALPTSAYRQVHELNKLGMTQEIFKQHCKFKLEDLSPAQLHAIDRAMRYLTGRLEDVEDVRRELDGIEFGHEHRSTAANESGERPSSSRRGARARSGAIDTRCAEEELDAPRCQLSVACGGGKTAILIWIYVLFGGPTLVLTNNSENKEQFLRVVLSDTNLDAIGEVRIVGGSEAQFPINSVSKFKGFDSREHVIPESTSRTFAICDSNHLNDLANGTPERKTLNAQMLSVRWGWTVVLVDEADETMTPKLREIFRSGLLATKAGVSIRIPFPKVPIVFTSGTLLADDKQARAFFAHSGGPLLHVSSSVTLEERGLLAPSRMSVVLCRDDDPHTAEAYGQLNSQFGGMLPSAMRALEQIVTLHTMYRHKIIIFTWYVEQAKALKRLFPSAEIVIGEDVSNYRSSAFEKFEAEFEEDHPAVFGTTSLKQRGYDHPPTAVGVTLGCGSADVIDQRHGRVKRRDEKNNDKISYFYIIADDTTAKKRGWGEGDFINEDAVLNSKQFKLLCINGYREKLRGGLTTANNFSRRVEEYLFERAPESHRLGSGSSVVKIDARGNERLDLATDYPEFKLAHVLRFFEAAFCAESHSGESRLEAALRNAAQLQMYRSNQASSQSSAVVVSSGGPGSTSTAVVVSSASTPNRHSEATMPRVANNSLSNKYVTQKRKRASKIASDKKSPRATQGAANTANSKTRKNIVDANMRSKFLCMVEKLSLAGAASELEDAIDGLNEHSTNQDIWNFVDKVYAMATAICERTDKQRLAHRNFYVKQARESGDVRCEFLEG